MLDLNCICNLQPAPHLVASSRSLTHQGQWSYPHLYEHYISFLTFPATQTLHTNTHTHTHTHTHTQTHRPWLIFQALQLQMCLYIVRPVGKRSPNFKQSHFANDQLSPGWIWEVFFRCTFKQSSPIHLFIQKVFIEYIPSTKNGDTMVMAINLGSRKREKQVLINGIYFTLSVADAVLDTLNK